MNLALKIIAFLLIGASIVVPLMYKREIRNGWLGPNASVVFDHKILNDLMSQQTIPHDSIVLFDDYTYLYTRRLVNKKIPITYSKLYADKIDNLFSLNMNGKDAYAITRVEFINELKILKNQNIEITTIKCTPSVVGQFCLTKIKSTTFQ